MQDVGAEKDAITALRAPTHFGRPNWDRVFGSIVEKHPETDVGVVCELFGDVTTSVADVRSLVLLRSACPLEAAAPNVEQVLAARRHAVLLRKGYVLATHYPSSFR